MSDVLSKIFEWISSNGDTAYIVSLAFLLFGVFLIRVKIISATNRSVAFSGKNSGQISTGDINKASNSFLTIVALLGLIVAFAGVLIAYFAWKSPVNS